MKIVFMGTPDFAAQCLKDLYEAGHEILAVYSKPDMPKNRGMKLLQTPVKEYALERGLTVIQPTTFKDDSVVEELRKLAPELIVVVAYGKLLPKRVLEIPKYGCVNVHGSILPKYRGSAPIQWSILNGDARTGVTTMMMDETMDTGDIIEVAETDIGPNENCQQLWDRLAVMGGQLICQTVKRFESGDVTTLKQDNSQATFAPMLTKEMAPINWSDSPEKIHCQVRGLYNWPVATAAFGGKTFKIYETALTEKTTQLPDGSVAASTKQGIEIACGGGKVILVKTLQAQGGKRMAAADYLRGHPGDFGFEK